MFRFAQDDMLEAYPGMIEMKRLQPYMPAAAIFCLALFVRVVYNVTAGRGYTPTYDSHTYQQLALNILHYHCFCQAPGVPMVGREPFWPAVIAVIYDMLSPRNIYVRLFLSVVGSGTCVLVYLFARDLFGRRIALVAGIFAAIYPNLFIYDGWLYSESLYIFLLFAFCYSLYLVQRTAHYRWMIVSGVCLGLLSLTRANGLIVLLLVAIWAIVLWRSGRLAWPVAAKSAAAVVLISLAIVAPWTVRNYVTFHEFIPTATGEEGIVLLGAYNNMVLEPGPFQGIWIRPTLSNPGVANRYYTSDSQQNQVYTSYAVQWIESHLNDMPYLLGMHFIKMWTPATPEADLAIDQFPTRLSSRIVWAMIDTMSIPLFILAALGLLATWRKWRELLIIYLMIALTVAECLYFYGCSRFRAPIEPMLVLLAAGFLWWVTEKDRGTLRWLLDRHKQAPPVSPLPSHVDASIQ